MTDARMSKPPPPSQGNGDDDSGEKTTTKIIKTIYLIRHAESEENRRLGSLRNALYSASRLSIPSMHDIRASIELVNISAQVDSTVSIIGQEQIKTMADVLDQDNFIQTSGIQLVVHSPLERARQTCYGMLQCRAAAVSTANAANAGTTNNDDDDDVTKCHVHATVQRVEELQLLMEKTPMEWVPGMTESFHNRIAAFEDWLQNQPETIVAVVGHSQYFRNMLNLPYKFNNCDVWKVQFDYSASRRDVNGNNMAMITTTSSNTTGPQATTTAPSSSSSSGSVATTTNIKSTFANWIPSFTMKRGNDVAAASPLVDSCAEQSSSSSSVVPPELPPQWSALELLYKCSIVSKKEKEEVTEPSIE